MKPILGTLYVGTSEPSWISRTEVPLLIPYHRLMRRWAIEWHHRVLLKTGVYDAWLPGASYAVEWLESRRKT